MAVKTQKKAFSAILWLLFLVAVIVIGLLLILKEEKPNIPKYTMVFSETVENNIEDIDALEEREDIIEETLTSNPFNIPNPQNPKIAIIINDLGVNENLTDVINKSVNENIVLAFSPYSRNLQEMINATHDMNKEAYLKLISASDDYLTEDNGPKSLSFQIDSNTDKDILADLLINATNVDGIIMDGFIAPEKEQGISDILQIIKANNLLVIDATDNDVLSNAQADDVYKIRADIIVKEDTTKDKLAVFLETAETIAKEKGQAVIVINPKPINIMMLVNWIDKISKEENPITIVPLSTLTDK